MAFFFNFSSLAIPLTFERKGVMGSSPQIPSHTYWRILRDTVTANAYVLTRERRVPHQTTLTRLSQVTRQTRALGRR